MYRFIIGNRRLAAGLVLVAFAHGCHAPRPRPLAQETRQTLGVVGVYSVGPPPDAVVAGPVDVGKQRLVGAAKGGGIGVLAGTGGGALTGAGVGLVCGPWAVVCSPVFALWGAAIGAAGGLLGGSAIGVVSHGANAIPTDVAERARTALVTVVGDRDLQSDLRQDLLATAPEDDHRIDLGGAAVAEPSTLPNYRRFVDEGAHSVLEVGLTAVTFAGQGGEDPELTLTLKARARLVAVPENEVLWTDADLVFESVKAKLSTWTASDSRLIASELDRGMDVLAQRIATDVFPDARVASLAPAGDVVASR